MYCLLLFLLLVQSNTKKSFFAYKLKFIVFYEFLRQKSLQNFWPQNCFSFISFFSRLFFNRFLVFVLKNIKFFNNRKPNIFNEID